ncbi:hypothetical protein ACIQF6_16050 [Kitasatospora sp. NPDC092948]|uniref:hypothetical protein n=1 Tax=Kitasatospora sp. NPDC092948 TaxID=3364088 RepID=UPI0037FDCCDD
MNETSKANDDDLPRDEPKAAEPAEEAAPEPAPWRPAAGSQAEQDAIFAELVGRFDEPVDAAEHDWPEAENVRERPRRPGAPTGPTGLGDFAPRPVPRPVEGPRDYTVAEDEEEGHFVPPEPPPLPAADTTAKFAWLAVLGGPALLLFDAVVWREVSGWPAWVGVIAFLGGFGTLVSRMKDRDDDEPEDPNGGAVV